MCVQNTASSLNLGQDYIFKETIGTTQEEEHGGTTNKVCVQNTASSLNMGQDCIIKEIVATTQEEEQGSLKLGSPPPMMNCHSVVYYLVALRWRRAWNLRRMKPKIGALQDPEKTKTNIFCI